MPTVLRFRTCLLAAALLLASCSDSAGPDSLPDDALTILRVAADAPPLEETETSFYAVRGEGREGIIYFQDGEGGRGHEYLRFTLDNESLVADANGLAGELKEAQLQEHLEQAAGIGRQLGLTSEELAKRLRRALESK